MRLLQFSVIAALALPLAGPAFAQEAGDCDMLCRLRGYLSADHMAAGAPDDAPARAPAKGRHLRAAARKPPPRAEPVAVAAATPRGGSVPQTAPAARAPVAKRAGQARPEAAAVKPPRPLAAVAAATALPAAKAARTPEAPRRPAEPRPVASRPVASRPVVAEAEPARPVAVPKPTAQPGTARGERTARAVQTARPTRTASLSTVIPGSAPPMQAGFH